MRVILVFLVLGLTISARAFDINSVAVKLNAKYGVPVEYTESVLSKARIVNGVKMFVTRVSSPPEKVLSYSAFRGFFVNEKRIHDGVMFFKQHRKLLLKVYKKYGVDPCIIVAILSIETNLGKEKPKYNCLNSLYTLAQFSKRKRYFLYELESFIAYTYKHNIDPFSVVGSMTCAMGMPQFMPSNVDKYGVDFNGNGLNLNEIPDAVASVANYLVHMGWAKDKPVILPCKDSNGKNVICVQYSKGRHACFRYYKNFIALKHYNGTQNYALAVYELAKNICKFVEKCK